MQKKRETVAQMKEAGHTAQERACEAECAQLQMKADEVSLQLETSTQQCEWQAQHGAMCRALSNQAEHEMQGVTGLKATLEVWCPPNAQV